MKHSQTVRGACLIAAVAIAALSLLSGTWHDDLKAQTARPHAATPNSETFRKLSAEADSARDAQQLSKAIPLYRRALALNPKWTEGWWSLGTIYYDSDSYASAANAFQHVATLDPKQGTALAMLGLCEFELGQSDAALRHIEASNALGVIDDPQLRQVVLFHEGLLQQRAGHFEAAQNALDSLCRVGVRNDQLIATLGMVSLRMRNPAPPDGGTEAAQVVERIGHGACLAAQKNFDAARNDYAWAVEHDPHFPYVHYAYGRFLVGARDPDAAVAQFEQEIKEQPTDVLARLQIGAALYKSNSAAALPFVKDAVQLAPKMSFAHYLLGLLLLDTGDYAGCIPHLELAEKAFPNEAKLFWSLAVAYSHAGRPQDAARARATFARLNKADAVTPRTGQVADEAPKLELTEKSASSRKTPSH